LAGTDPVRSERVVVKLSEPLALGAGWSEDTAEPVLAGAFTAFGPSRCMLAGNLPVDRPARGDGDLWRSPEGTADRLAPGRPGRGAAGVARRAHPRSG